MERLISKVVKPEDAPAAIKWWAEQPGKVFTRDELLERGAEVFDRTIDVQIGHIRSALGESGKKRIVTVRGAGYLFAKRQD